MNSHLNLAYIKYAFQLQLVAISDKFLPVFDIFDAVVFAIAYCGSVYYLSPIVLTLSTAIVITTVWYLAAGP